MLRSLARRDSTKGTNKDYEIDRREFGWANSTINRCRNALRAALKHRLKAYAPTLPTLPVTKKKERRLASWEAIKLCRAVLPRRFRYLNLFIRIGLGTGARHEAILALTWDQVDLETGRIDFRPRDKKGNILSETKKKRSTHRSASGAPRPSVGVGCGWSGERRRRNY